MMSKMLRSQEARIFSALLGLLFLVASCSSQQPYKIGRHGVPYPLAVGARGSFRSGRNLRQHPYDQPSRRDRSFRNQEAIQNSYAPSDASPFSISEAGANVADAPTSQLTFGSSYTRRYPLTSPVIKYRIGVISDLDEDSFENSTNSWIAYLREADLSLEQNLEDPGNPNITLEWKEDRIHSIRSGLSYSHRGVELSTLNVFNGHLYSCDDKTGVVYELPIGDSLDIVPIPWAILANGNFTGPNGFKCEWATVKDNLLWVGGHGQNDVDRKTGNVTGMNQKFIKVISPTGEVKHLDWRLNFDKMAEALDVHIPGYIEHESCAWSDIRQQWLFMPRHISKEIQKDSDQGTKASNTLLFADEDFENVQVGHAGDLNPSHGFSSFKFVPGTGDQVVLAIKSLEIGDKTESFILAFNVNGKVLLPETKFADQKYEGVEFI